MKLRPPRFPSSRTLSTLAPLDQARVLSTVTGKLRTKKAARALLGGNYCMTADAVLKMAAIKAIVRLSSGRY